MRRAFRSATAAIALLSLAAAPVAAEAPARPEPAAAKAASRLPRKPEKPAPAASPLEVRVGEAKGLSHIEFRWAGGAKMTTRRDGQALVVTFDRNARPDMSRLSVDPPAFLKGAEARTAGGGLQLVLTLADDADAKTGFADGASYVNLFQKAPDPNPPPAPAEAPALARPDPAPDSGVVVAQAVRSGPQTMVSFPWKAQPGAAAFRRGQAVWLVFDAKAMLNVQAASQMAAGIPMRVVQGADYTAVRFGLASDAPYSLVGQGATWKLIMGPGPQARSLQVAMARDASDGPATLAANVAGSTRVVWLDDPVVGDKLAVVTALAPSKGLLFRREYVDLSVLPSAHGLAIEPAADNLAITTDGDVVRITRQDGLKLSPQQRTRMASELKLPEPAAMPGLVDFERWSQTGPGGFTGRYDALMGAVANEANRQFLGDKSAGMTARLGMARFLVGSELSYEAIGALNLLAKTNPEITANAEFRGLRGAARVMAGRYREAQNDFSSPALAEDPASALWRGYTDARLGLWTDARQEFEAGKKAMPLVAPAWRARFARANAEASLRLNDFTTAHAQLTLALKQPEEPMERLATLLVFARLIEAEGSPAKALPIYDAIARAPSDRLSAPALLHATQIRLYGGKLAPDKAADTFNSLRFRWRGDSTELEIIRALGQLYLAQGRYRDALEALRSARQRMSDLPEAVQIADDLSGAFRDLYLNGGADGLEPVQALGLFYDFKELTPVGADGDEMVRKLAQRLVNVDLLEQAGELLKYQAESRLDGVPRALVATDEAIIDLMARRPELALNALNASRTTLLPTPLQTQRRLIEARAWIQLNQLDHAAEILGTDSTVEGTALRAEVAWRKRDWATAGKTFESSLGERWRIPEQPLAPEDESKLLRAAVAYSLALDDAGLERLRERYQPYVDRGRWPEAMRVALSGVNVEQITSANFAQAISDDQTFTGWVTKMKARFRERTLGSPLPAPSLRPLTTAVASEAETQAAAATKTKAVKG